MDEGVRLGRYIVTLHPSVASMCRKANLDPKDLYGCENKPEHVYAAGRWCNGVDLEPWNRQPHYVGAEVTLMFRGGQRLGFWWGTTEPWATTIVAEQAKVRLRLHVTHDALGEVAR